VTVIVLASVSTRLPWQNGHAVGLLIVSFIRDSDIVGVFHLAFIKVFALFTNAHESERPRPCRADTQVQRGLDGPQNQSQQRTSRGLRAAVQIRTGRQVQGGLEFGYEYHS
jgi:hypothetical protein